MKSISCKEKSLANATTLNGREDLQPFLLIGAVPSCCMSETANCKVDSEAGSLESMGSDLDSNLLLEDEFHRKRRRRMEAKTLLAQLRHVWNQRRHIRQWNWQLRLHGQRPEFIPCSGMSSDDTTTSSGKGDPPGVAPSGYTGSREAANLKVSTFACSGKSSMNAAPEASIEDTQASERLNQLAEAIGASKTIAGTLRLCALVVDAAPYDVGAMTESLLATMIQEDDTELEEAAAPYDEDFFLVRAVMTGWKCCEEGERDVDVLVAAAVEAVEKDVTDQDMLMDLFQMIQEVFRQVGSPCPLGGLELGSV